MPSRFDGDNVHLGYMCGLRGEDPEDGYGEGYELGWLAGAEDRAAGKKAIGLGYIADEYLPVKPGDVVTIPKGVVTKTIGKPPKPAGRTYKVKVDHTLPGSNAYLEGNAFRRGVVRPTGPKVRWAGTGGYWAEADLDDVVKEPSSA